MGVGTRFIASHGVEWWGRITEKLNALPGHRVPGLPTPRDAINRVPTALDVASRVFDYSVQKSYTHPGNS
jgi:hypothetical protein